jgi:hypothetical protein
MQPFDFEYALYLHSGLEGWILLEGNPDNFQPGKPVVYIQNKDPEFIQRAVFTLEPDETVNMALNDNQRIVGVEIPYMKILYTRDTNASQTNESATV